MTCCHSLHSLPQLLGSLLLLPLLLVALIFWVAVMALIASVLIMQQLWSRASNALRSRLAQSRYRTLRSSTPTKKHGPELSISRRKWPR